MTARRLRLHAKQPDSMAGEKKTATGDCGSGKTGPTLSPVEVMQEKAKLKTRVDEVLASCSGPKSFLPSSGPA